MGPYIISSTLSSTLSSIEANGAFPAATVGVPGTCGELVQGWHSEWNEPVLVSCPIERYSRVTVRLRPRPLLTTPAGDYIKLRQAARLALEELERPDLGAEIDVSTELLRGRGMASSTADIVAVMMALSTALKRPFSRADLVRLACRIEPSDSIMFDGLVVLAYRGSGQYQELGPPPNLPLLMLDTGQAVDTVTYNAQLNLAAVRALAPVTRIALDYLHEGTSRRNPAALGAAATLSATSYQAISYNPLLSQAQHWAAATGALGIVRAHSGSVIGLLYDCTVDLAEPARWLAARFSGTITMTRLTGGYSPDFPLG